MFSNELMKQSDGNFYNWSNNIFRSEVCTDSRKFISGESFFAIKTEVRDGFDFAIDVLKKGTTLVVCESTSGRTEAISNLSKEYPHTMFVIVDNVVKYMQILAIRKVNEFKSRGGKIIGITGSNGKTTTKDMLFSLLSSVAANKVWATTGNFNNHIGVPITIFKIENHHEIAIIEMGTNHPGEIKVLCDIAMPSMGIISSIGEAHIEFFGSKENIFKEKRSLFDAIVEFQDKNSCFIAKSDCKFLGSLKAPFVKYVEKNKTYRIQDGNCEIEFNNRWYDISNPNYKGEHNISNMVSALLLAFHIFPEKIESLILCAKQFVPGKNRSQIINLNNQTIYLDAYNANPSSMEASILAFTQLLDEEKALHNQTICVLGDMNELGDFAPQGHKRIGQLLAKLGYLNVVFIGRYSQHYLEGFGPKAQCFKTLSDFHSTWRQDKNKYKYFFIKGSRSLQLESLMDIK